MAQVPSAPFHGTIPRGPDSRHRSDFRAEVNGDCGRCGESYAAGTVVVLGVRGLQHRVCPCDLPSEDAS
ncbi:MAG: hypothetical protein JWM85_2329 [Acidimicrobiaceae bacterium]|nr:hypothetical protein [Acidimicrobiaceae bacterium]